MNIRGRSYTIAAARELETAEAEGVLFAHGGVGGGHALYVQDGRLHYVYNWLGERQAVMSSDAELEPGRHVLTPSSQRPATTSRERPAPPARSPSTSTTTRSARARS